MRWDNTAFDAGALVCPQPLAICCGRICRARTSHERLDAILKCAEVLTRYLCALAISSFCAREDPSVSAPPALGAFAGNLSFGAFLSVVQAIAGLTCEHPLKGPLTAAFKAKGGKAAIANDSLTALLNLRNDLGHNLMAGSEARAQAIFEATVPPDLLLMHALKSIEGLLNLPLFLVEEQRPSKGKNIARRLLFMGESLDPLPEEIALSGWLNDNRVLYLGVAGGVISLAPFLIWDLARQRANYGIYFVQSIERDRLDFVTLNDDDLREPEMYRQIQERLAGAPCPKETVALADGTDFLREWLSRRRDLEKARGDVTRKIPWGDLDAETLRWYGQRLGVADTADTAEIQSVITERLFDGRDKLNADELAQVLLLFGRESVVHGVLHRNLIDCRARTGGEKRVDDRIEESANILRCLKVAIEFFGRHIGVGGVTVDGLTATSGSADYIAMREGLVNLFIHQDYSDTTVVSQIEISPDQTLFFNAGVSLVKQEDLLSGSRSQSRNPLISRALRLIGFAELAGSGIREMDRAWRQARRRPPVLTSNPTANTFSLTLDWRAAPDTSDAFWKHRLGVALEPGEVQALLLSTRPEGVSLEELASTLELTHDAASHVWSVLVKAELVAERGSRLHIRDHLQELAEEWRQQGG